MKVFDGVPHPYDVRKKVVVRKALKILQLRNFRKFCVLGDLCQKVGWKKQDLLSKLEESRKLKGKTYYARKLARENLRRKAEDLPEVKGLRSQLEKLGY